MNNIIVHGELSTMTLYSIIELKVRMTHLVSGSNDTAGTLVPSVLDL